MPSKYTAFVIISFLAILNEVNAQSYYPDSLEQVLQQQPDTLKIKTLLDLAAVYDEQEKHDTALTYYLNALKLAEDTHIKQSIFECLVRVADFYENLRKRDLALEFALNAKKVAEEQNNKENLFEITDVIGGFIYFNSGNFDQSLKYGLELRKLAGKLNDRKKIAYSQMNLGDVYRVLNKFDSSLELYGRAINTWKELGDTNMIRSSLNNIGVIYEAQKKYEKAISYFLQADEIAENQNNIVARASYAEAISRKYLELKNLDSSLLYAKKSLDFYALKGTKGEHADIYSLLAEIYAAKPDYKKAYYYLSLFEKIMDSVLYEAAQSNMDSLESQYKIEKANKEIEFFRKETALQSRVRNMFIAASVLLIVIAFLIANKYRLKKRSETVLNVKNIELNKTIEALRSTQAQLIQSEKMASLGELTAGIAHEIQNPLNFVNNFSEVNKELIEELKGERHKTEGERNMAGEDEILNDIDQNLEKIVFHGKRADSIVKGMMQHSKQTSGVKEPTDINALCDEYLRLSYHGLRSKDKNFNADFKTDFDKSIGKINVVRQDMERVLLNLYNNAFYTTNERFKNPGGFQNPRGLDTYQPTISVQTKKLDHKVEIRVADNGNGIPQHIIDKIFQPFFTTKLTGQATGLGLSLAYDIITKEHNGTIKVESRDGKGSEFIIILQA